MLSIIVYYRDAVGICLYVVLPFKDFTVSKVSSLTSHPHNLSPVLTRLVGRIQPCGDLPYRLSRSPSTQMNVKRASSLI